MEQNYLLLAEKISTQKKMLVSLVFPKETFFFPFGKRCTVSAFSRSEKETLFARLAKIGFASRKIRN